MRLSAMLLVNSVANFGSPVWFLSKHVHLIDTQLNNILRCVSGTVRANPTPWLPVLCDIVPATFRGKKILKNLIFYQNSLLYDVFHESGPERLRSFYVVEQFIDEVMVFDLNKTCKDWWLHELIIDPTLKIYGFELLRGIF